MWITEIIFDIPKVYEKKCSTGCSVFNVIFFRLDHGVVSFQKITIVLIKIIIISKPLTEKYYFMGSHIKY